MIKHIVFWKVKEELRQEAFETFKKALEDISEQD